MPSLVLDHAGTRRAALLPRRVLIGRRGMNQLVIDDPAVSRMHAWIEGNGDRYFLNDTGSRTGTHVNGRLVRSRHRLSDGDEIRIGPARLTFHGDGALPQDAEPFNIPPAAPVPGDESGVLFECGGCGAPLWASATFAGKAGQCRYCGTDVVVPAKSPAAGSPVERATASGPGAKPRVPATLGRGKQAAARPPELRQAPATRPPTSETPRAPGLGKSLPRSHAAAARDSISAKVPGVPAPAPAATPSIFGDAVARHDTAGAADELLALPTRPADRVPRVAVPRSAPNVPRRTIEASLAPSARPAAEEEMCGVCQSSITAFEEKTHCPSCGLAFHAECWAENLGCSAYGCSQVNALAPPDPSESAPSTAVEGGIADESTSDPALGGSASAPFPWEFLLLACSVFAALIGAFTFGVPSLLVAAGIAVYVVRGRRRDRRAVIVWLSTGLAVVGIVTGVMVSYLFYFGRHLG